jgi:hypothetical protein
VARCCPAVPDDDRTTTAAMAVNADERRRDMVGSRDILVSRPRRLSCEFRRPTQSLAKGKSMNHEEHGGHEGKHDRCARDLRHPLTWRARLRRAAVCGRLATRQDAGQRKGLVGRGSSTHRLAAAGGRQVSAVFVSFVSFVVQAFGGSPDTRDRMLLDRHQACMIQCSTPAPRARVAQRSIHTCRAR